MIDSIRSYHKYRALFEKFVIDSDKFSQVEKTIDIKTNLIQYPIRANETGVHIYIDEYKAFITGFPKVIYNNANNPKLHAFSNLSYSKFTASLDLFYDYVIEPKETKVSAVKFGFSIPTTLEGMDIIKLNILMHKFRYYNHNAKPKNDQVFKEYVYTNYTIGIYADKKDDSKKFFIKIVLHLRKSREFKKIGLVNMNDLLEQKTLEALFGLLMKKFDELIIVDNFQSFNGRDSDLLEEFMIHRYWENLARTAHRQTVYRKGKKFLLLINKYNLNKQKKYFKKELEKAFVQFIST